MGQGASMQLIPELLNARPSASAPVFAATIGAHGIYSTNQFVLRLSPLIHQTLSSLQPGIGTNSKIGLDGAQAMSTYLHETIHWWQHIGSTYGFIFGLNYPVQAHATFNDLKTIIAGDGFKKSVIEQGERLSARGPTGWGTLAGTTNMIVNNHFDLEVFRLFTYSPKVAQTLAENPRFEAVGHAVYMTYGHTIGVLASSVDERFNALPDFRLWKDGFDELRKAKREGYYYGSPIGLWPLGSYEIFEGQARFSQIQYLSHACGHNLDWSSYASLGMLNGVYVSAFQHFLELTESEWPERVDDPLVSLFLLVCDLAINPGSGFPVSVAPNFASFIEDVNPGARFTFFCRFIAKDYPAMKGAIRLHSREEYAELTSELAYASKDFPPLLLSELCTKWFSSNGPLAHLRGEYEAYQFDPKNYVIRHLFAHFLAFQEDRFKAPEFFCWPGAHMAGANLSDRSSYLFDKHGALFVDKEDDDSVFPRMQDGRSEEIIDDVFQNFYAGNVTYDLVRQWINEPGPFKYDLSWLKANSSKDEQCEFMRRQFKSAFGVDPNDAEILMP
ncbi:hypothetical protein [Mesorhizobium sp.]|uniref:hypothetical protein n=1 Tax=Mesorhizobium sp. TaxID=1871066 RepID=UPI0011FF86F4|nr:hypothetical protein [Mesorhizobium sp.]TIL38596.1 MAG: hypothetical protein E5Y82_13975 [Mesorhizobium sp.]